MGKTLIIGAGGQIGTELTETLRARRGGEQVIASDIREVEALGKTGPFTILNAMDREGLFKLIEKEGIDEIYHLAAVLSATGEKNPMFAWDLNMQSLLHVLNAAVERGVKKIFWPSSIAVFGPHTPRIDTPQYTVMDPNTVYGNSKLAGERWCEWYFEKHGVDVRSLRYPGLIGYKSLPGGGTTDYAVDIFHKALNEKKFTSFLAEGTGLPMMYMPDAIRATIELMEAPAETIKIRSSYNVSGMSFAPEEISAEIQKHVPDFKVDYAPDFRQQIAESWPQSIDDNRAREDWGWNPEFDLAAMVKDMLENVQKYFNPQKI